MGHGGQATPISGGSILTVVYRLTPPIGEQVADADLDQAVAVMQSRLESTGVQGWVMKQPPDKVEVLVSGVFDDAQVLSLLGHTGTVDLVALPTAAYGTVASPGPSALPREGEAFDPASGDRLSPQSVPDDREGNSWQ